MENSHPDPEAPESSDLGPRATAARPHLSRGRRTVLDALARLDRPATLSDLSVATGLHENTLRGHLEALARDGLVSRAQAEPAGRGRPAWLWSAHELSTHAEYAGLATALARTLARTSTHPQEDATEAGRAWGHELAASSSTDASAAPRRRILGLLADLGFAPEERPAGAPVRLTCCPLLDVAREHPGIVCNVHRGLLAGALDQYDAPGTEAELQPFAELGACLLRISPA